MTAAAVDNYTTRSFQALNFAFTIEVPHPALARYLDDAFGACAANGDGNGAHRYAIVEHDERLADRYELRLDGKRVDAFSVPSAALALLLWHVNRQVVARSADRYLLVHASAAVLDRRAFVFPAPMESGKSTLVAGLVAGGFDYLTDEAAAIDPATGVVVPYAKPLSLDTGSWPVLPALDPRNGSELQEWVTRQWHVPPDRVRAGAVGDPAPVRFIVCPRYDPATPSALEPLDRPHALVAVIENSFNFRHHGAAGLAALRAVVARSRCFRLAINDLDDACRLLHELAPSAPPEEAPQ